MSANAKSPLQLAALALFVLAGPIGIALGLLDELPARVGCDCTAADVGSDWVQHGTATSAPLLPLFVLALGFVLSLRPGRLHVVGVIVLVLVAVAAFVGTLGEPFVPPEADAPHFLLAIFRTLSYVAAASVVVLGVRDLVQTLRSAPPAAEASGS